MFTYLVKGHDNQLIIKQLFSRLVILTRKEVLYPKYVSVWLFTCWLENNHKHNVHVSVTSRHNLHCLFLNSYSVKDSEGLTKD